MCHDTSSRPPSAPNGSPAAVAGSRHVVLAAGDGNRFTAFSATTTVADAPGMMILPDVRGLHPFYEALALRFAEAGVHATVMDYFGRTAGLAERGANFDFMTHARKMTPDGTAADTLATLDYLRSAEGGGATRLFSVGFCMGGRISFNQAWRDHGLAGVIGFYGVPQGTGPNDDSAPVRLAPTYRCPVLGLFGGADPNIPAAAVEQFRRALTTAGVPNEIVSYPGAPHSFFDRRFDEHRAACADAWQRVLRFVAHGGPADGE